MSEKSFTFFEIHLHDGFSFSATNTAPAIGGSSDEEAEADASDADRDESSGLFGGESSGPLGGSDGSADDGLRGRRVGALVALLLLFALAAAAKSLRGDDESGELTELEDFTEE